MARIPKPSGVKSAFGQPRDLSNSRKKVGTRAYKKQIIIVVEGTETERLYFEDLAKEYHIPTVKVSIVDSNGKTDPDHIIDKALRTRMGYRDQSAWDENEDEIWCVFDTDNRTGLLEAYARADKEKMKLAVSNPAFEYWYLLHYEETDREFPNADAVISRLRIFIKDYDKSRQVYSKIKGNCLSALQCAQKLRNRNSLIWEEKGNPSTGVDILVNEIQSLAGK